MRTKYCFSVFSFASADVLVSNIVHLKFFHCSNLLFREYKYCPFLFHRQMHFNVVISPTHSEALFNPKTLPISLVNQIRLSPEIFGQ